MKKAYLAIGYQSRSLLSAEVETIRTALRESNWDLCVFVDQYTFLPQQAAGMMQQAFEEIRRSDLLIAEVTEKAIGVGIEMGYAAAAKLPVWYLRKQLAEYSTTAAGTASTIIVYDNAADLAKKLKDALTLLDSKG